MMKKILFSLAIILLASHASFAQIVYNGVHVVAGSSNQTSVTSGAIDTTGASLLVFCTATSGTTNNAFSDSKGNTWTALTAQAAGLGAATAIRGFYAINPIVGTGHTFSLASVASSFPTLIGLGASGTAVTSPLDTQNGVSNTTFPSTDTTQAVGSITPSAITNIMTACITFNNSVTSVSVNSSYSITDTITNDGNHFAMSMAYKLSPSGAQNPTFSWTTADSPGAIHADFKVGPLIPHGGLTGVGAGR